MRSNFANILSEPFQIASNSFHLGTFLGSSSVYRFLQTLLAPQIDFTNADKSLNLDILLDRQIHLDFGQRPRPGCPSEQAPLWANQTFELLGSNFPKLTTSFGWRLFEIWHLNRKFDPFCYSLSMVKSLQQIRLDLHFCQRTIHLINSIHRNCSLYINSSRNLNYLEFFQRLSTSRLCIR